MLLKNIFRNFSESFLFRLFLCFVVIISIFSAFQIIAYNLYIKNLEKEIARQTKADLKISSGKFAGIVERTFSSLLSLYMSEDFRMLRTSNAVGMYDLYRIVQRLSSAVANEGRTIRDIFLLKDDSSFVASGYGSYVKELYFTIAFSNPDYNLTFWRRLCAGKIRFMTLPYKPFRSRDRFSYSIEDNYLIPLVFKPNLNSRFLLVALLDVNAVIGSIDRDSGKDFYIYEKGKLLYPEVDSISSEMKNTLAMQNKSLIKRDGRYYFSHFSEDRNYFFIKIIPYRRIQDGLQKIRILLFCTLFFSIIISFIVSAVLSVKINKPIKEIVDSIGRKQVHYNQKKGVNELEFINKNLQTLLIENERFSKDINKKNSILKKYFYLTKLKDIYADFGNIKSYLMNRRFFVIIYFTIHYKMEFYSLSDDSNKATFFLSRLIQEIISEKALETLAFQIEHDQIISIIGFDQKQLLASSIVNEVIEKLKNENEYLFLTVAISDKFKDISRLNAAYSEVYRLAGQRTLNQVTQVLTSERLVDSNSRFYFSNKQERDFSSLLLNGRIEGSIDLVDHILDMNFQKKVSLSYFQKLSSHLVNECVCVFTVLGLKIADAVDIDDIYSQINGCFTIKQFKNLFADFVTALAKPLANSIQKSDYIKNYVLTYIEKHYSEDVYLDLLSGKLGITSNYLCRNFKMKTGMHFIDYLNNFRIERAKELLLETSQKIKSVAHGVGYRSENTFIRIFKKYTAQTPGEFRRNIFARAHA